MNAMPMETRGDGNTGGNTGGYQPPDMDLGNKPRSSAKAVRVVNRCGTSPV